MDRDNLDVDMSNLEINEKKRISSGVFKYKISPDESPISSQELDENMVQPRRSGRKRIRSIETEKRRVLTKPKKILDSKNTREINNYYLDKRIKRLPSSLETIFEEPKGDNYMSTRKYRRSIEFCNQLNTNRSKLKVKKRVMKAKKVCIIKRLSKKVAMDLLQTKLSIIEDDSTDSTDKITN